MSQFVLAVDFDGTCVKFRYPKVGPDVPLAAAWLRRLVQAGAQLVLSTMRGDEHTHLPAAVAWFEKHELPLYGVNENPMQITWTMSPKVWADAIIDDSAIGCPLVIDPKGKEAAYVDWEIAGPMIMRLIEQHHDATAA